MAKRDDSPLSNGPSLKDATDAAVAKATAPPGKVDSVASAMAKLPGFTSMTADDVMAAFRKASELAVPEASRDAAAVGADLAVPEPARDAAGKAADLAVPAKARDAAGKAADLAFPGIMEAYNAIPESRQEYDPMSDEAAMRSAKAATDAAADKSNSRPRPAPKSGDPLAKSPEPPSIGGDAPTPPDSIAAPKPERVFQPGVYKPTAKTDPYTYEVLGDGSIKILSGPTGAGFVVKAGTIPEKAIRAQLESGLLQRAEG